MTCWWILLLTSALVVGLRVWPMLGREEEHVGTVFVVRRLYWRGRWLPLGQPFLRWVLTARQRGYDYPDKVERGQEDL